MKLHAYDQLLSAKMSRCDDLKEIANATIENVVIKKNSMLQQELLTSGPFSEET